jgi:hypothetical protein
VRHSIDDAFADRLRDHLYALLERRHGVSTVCPTEAAHELAHELKIEWRELMRPIRQVATELAERGKIEVLQHGVPVSLREARGPVQVRLKRR